MKLQKSVIITSFLFILLAALFIWRNTSIENSPETPPATLLSQESDHISKPKNQKDPSLPELNSANLSVENSYEVMADYCRTQYPEQSQMIPSEKQVRDWLNSGMLKSSWRNVHLKTQDNSVMRVRRFSDDGPNGAVEKLVIFKEDDTGFPEIVEIPEAHRTNPTQEVVDQYLKLGTSIFTDEGFTGDVGQKNVFLEVINGQVTRIDVSEGAKFLNCQSEY